LVTVAARVAVAPGCIEGGGACEKVMVIPLLSVTLAVTVLVISVVETAVMFTRGSPAGTDAGAVYVVAPPLAV
jgi:hypothetical protein